MRAAQPTILLLEDDLAIADLVRYSLEREGFAVRHAPLLRAAAALVADPAGLPDAAVLDVALPDGNGMDLCRRWRASPERRLATLPLLMLTARGEEMDRVLGLEAGADDYLPKPFSPRELVARVRALLRRAAMPRGGAAREHGAFSLDEAAQRISYAGVSLNLTRLEYALLAELLRAPQRIHAREQLFRRVWGEHSEAIDRTLDTHVKTLRAKLREVREGLGLPAEEAIVTHRGLGYALSDRPPGGPST